MGLGRNEAEVRYAICDPLMSMVCDCYSNTLKLEETVKNNLEMREVEDDDEKEEAVLVSLRTLWAEDKDQSAPPPPPPHLQKGQWRRLELELRREDAASGVSCPQTMPSICWGVLVKQRW